MMGVVEDAIVVTGAGLLLRLAVLGVSYFFCIVTSTHHYEEYCSTFLFD